MAKISAALFQSDKMDWETPKPLFDRYNQEFHFKLDAAANEKNHKVPVFYTKTENGLLMNWISPTWCNPPYGNGIIEWVKKAYEESKNGITSVLLLPARTDTKWFHEYVYGKAEIRFLRGRIKFVGAKSTAPFPSMIVIYRGV